MRGRSTPGSQWRALAAWSEAITASKALRVAALRVQTRVSRGCARLALEAWECEVAWRAASAKAEARLLRRQRHLCRAGALVAWRRIAHWQAHWRASALCIQRRWRVSVLRVVTYSWHAAVQRLRALQVSTKAFRRRCDADLAQVCIFLWAEHAALVATQINFIATMHHRRDAAMLRQILLHWGDVRRHASYRSYAANVVRRRHATSLLWGSYHRWSDWSYTCHQHRRAALRAFDRMRVCTASAQQCNSAWKRLSDNWVAAASAEIQREFAGQLRGHMTMALSRGLSRALLKLTRSIIHEWGQHQRHRAWLRDTAKRALRRSRARACAAILVAWSALLDRKSFVSLVQGRIRRRYLSSLLHAVVAEWRKIVLLAQRFLNRLRRLRRRIVLRALGRILRKWHVLAEERWRERVQISRLIIRGRVDLIGA